MKIVQVQDYEEMSQQACSFILESMNGLTNPVLGLATGSTPVGLYKNLIAAYKKGAVSFKHATTFNLDEYVGLNREDPTSYFYYMKENLFEQIDLLPENTHIPNGTAVDLQTECEEYEQRIKAVGPINLQVLGLGVNGHIGFNEPGTSFSSRTHIVDLAEATRKANARFFARMDEVPRQALTVGIATIMESKMILLLVSGEQKAEAFARLVNGEVSEEFPASILQKHPNVIVVVDEAARGSS